MTMEPLKYCKWDNRSIRELSSRTCEYRFCGETDTETAQKHNRYHNSSKRFQQKQETGPRNIPLNHPIKPSH